MKSLTETIKEQQSLATKDDTVLINLDVPIPTMEQMKQDNDKDIPILAMSYPNMDMEKDFHLYIKQNGKFQTWLDKPFTIIKMFQRSGRRKLNEHKTYDRAFYPLYEEDEDEDGNKLNTTKDLYFELEKDDAAQKGITYIVAIMMDDYETLAIFETYNIQKSYWEDLMDECYGVKRKGVKVSLTDHSENKVKSGSGGIYLNPKLFDDKNWEIVDLDENKIEQLKKIIKPYEESINEFLRK
jgi:hypothetical protein